MEEILKEALSNAPINNVIMIALIMIMCDLLSGFIKAFYNKDFKSAIAKKGLWEKCQWILIILVGYATNYLLNFSAIIYAICVCCVITEFMSILENAYECGIMKEYKIMDFLQIKSKEEK